MRHLVFAAAALAAAPALVAPAAADELPAVRLVHRLEIAAPAATVWTHLTSGQSLVTWCPYWKAPANAKVTLAKVGDALDFTDSWGNGGRSIVTYLAPNKEIRVAHEPNDGSYLCQAKVALAAGDKGTTLTYTEVYTDPSLEKDRKATAAKTDAEIRSFLAALKKQAEAK